MTVPSGLLALTVGSFGIGMTEFVIMGLLLEIGVDLQVSVFAAGMLFGAAAFGTVAPLQSWIIGKAQGIVKGLISSFNTAAFNLGDAIGAVAGGIALQHGPGLAAIPFVAAAFPMLALVTAWLSNRSERDPAAVLLKQGAEPSCGAKTY